MPAADPEAFRGTERFVVQQRLGAGSFGVVYEALDRDRGARVALKTLRADAGRALYRFKQEFRALADVSHPNVVALYELLSEGEQWFFTMERIDGVSFLQYVRGGDATPAAESSDFSSPTRSRLARAFEGQLSPSLGAWSSSGVAPASSSPIVTPPLSADGVQRLRQALRQLADGVGALHAAGKLHRDLKPSNVLVTGEGRVVILDFGLVRELFSGDLTHTAEAAGTPAYMSPEQADERALTEASDWYSVGVMTYEALTGQLPFAGPLVDLLRRKREEEPTPARKLTRGVPEDLDRLCADLLRRDCRRRPAGEEVRRRLSGGSSPRVTALNPAASAALFVGRRPQMTRLHEGYGMARSGRGITIGIHGGSGMGKTALVRHFLEELQAAHPDVVVLSGRCYERESTPYKALDSVVDALSQHLRRLRRSEVEALLPHDVLALARLFPVLRQVEAVARARRAVLDIPDSQELRRRAFAALRELLVRMADRHPLVVVIDDLQWGDIDSAALLTELLRPPDSPGLLLIGCYRSDEAATSPLLSAVLPLRDSPAAAGLEKMDIAVGELAPAEAHHLARALLGPDADASRAEAIARESKGNPFLIDALARFRVPDAMAGLAETVDGEAEPPAMSLDDVIALRVAGLAGPAQRLLQALAISGQPMEPIVAYQAAGLETEGEGAVAVLRAAHLVRTRRMRWGDDLEIYHDRIREAVARSLQADDLRSLHGRLATALLASGRADPERLATHFQESGQVDTAAEYSTAAAERAAEALAFDRAARLYRLAVSLNAEDPVRQRVLSRHLGDALANAGRGREAADAYLAAVGGTGAAEHIDLQRRAAEQLLISGHVEEGLRLLGVVLARLGMSLPASPRSAAAVLVLRRAFLRFRGIRFRRRDAALVPAWDLLKIDTCSSVAVGLGLIDIVRGSEFQSRHLMLALKAGEPHRVARALALEATYAAIGGTRSRARTDRLIGTADALASELGDPKVSGLTAIAAGISAWTQGRWRDGLTLCDRAVSILRERCTGVSWEIDNAQLYALASLFLLGEVAELNRRVGDLLKHAEERGDLMAATNLRLGFFTHMIGLAADDPEAARQELRLGLEGTQRTFDMRQLWARGALRDIALYAEEGLDEMEPVRETWRPAARSLDRFPQTGLILGLASRARRRLALSVRAASPAVRDAQLARAEAHARGIERERTPWGDALAVLVHAGAAATRGQSDRALALVSSAESALAAADMALHAAAARRRSGELAGGDAGAARIKEADAWMAQQSIRNPERMTRMLVPGRWSS